MSTFPPQFGRTTLNSVLEDRLRPFGSDFAPQRRAYLIYLPLGLILLAVVGWLIPGNATFVFGGFLGGLIGLYLLFDLLFRAAPLRLSTLAAMSILLGYNVGAFNSWLTTPRGGLTVAEYFARNPEALARGIAACMASAALLLVLGELYERPIFGREFRLQFGSDAVPLAVISTLLVLATYATGQVGFMGTSSDQAGHVNPITTLISWWSLPAFAYSVCAMLNTMGSRRRIIGFCALLQGVALVPIGRRAFAFALLLAMIGIRLGGRRAQMPVFKKLLIGAALAALVITASVAFLYLRVAGWEQRGKVSTVERVALAIEMVKKRPPSELLLLLKSDASKRTFTLGYFSDLLEATQYSSPYFGQDVLNNVQLAVPSVLSANKLGELPFSEEQMANMRWGFAYLDEANTLLTAGAVDFGMVGVFVYPLLFVLLMRVILEWVQDAMPTFLAAIVALSFTFQMLQTEVSLVSFFLQIRNTILVAILFYVFSTLPRFRLRPAD